MIPLLSKKFWCQNISETQAGSPAMIFGDVRQKARQNRETAIIQMIFDSRTFLKHRRVCPRRFPAIWDKKFSTEERDTPFISINFFRTRTVLKDKSVPPRSFSVLWDLNFSKENRETPLRWMKFLGALKIFESLEGSPQVFQHCETKTINRIVIPLLSKKFWNKNISETQTGSPAMILGDVRQKKLQESWYPYYPKKFDNRIFWNTEVFAHDVFRRFGTKIFDGKTWHPPLFSITFFRTRNFLKHRRVRPRCFSATWDKKIPTVKRDTHLLIPTFFPN